MCARRAGRHHGGAVSRKVVEEMVEKMENKSSTTPGHGGKLKEAMPRGEGGEPSKDLEWV